MENSQKHRVILTHESHDISDLTAAHFFRCLNNRCSSDDVNFTLTLLVFYLSHCRIVYSFCTEGKDLGVWYDNKNQKTANEMSGSEQLCLLINEFLNKHLREEVTKVKNKQNGNAKSLDVYRLFCKSS